jgi:hypothetical protein
MQIVLDSPTLDERTIELALNEALKVLEALEPELELQAVVKTLKLIAHKVNKKLLQVMLISRLRSTFPE